MSNFNLILSDEFNRKRFTLNGLAYDVRYLSTSIEYCKKVIIDFDNDYYLAHEYGVASTGHPIKTLFGPAYYNAIMKNLGSGNMYEGLKRRDEYVAAKTFLSTVNMMFGYIPS